jgi:hypothetical protein
MGEAISACSARTLLAGTRVTRRVRWSASPYLQPLLGGMANLRGFRAGTLAGDILVAYSAEFIVPLTSRSASARSA